MSFSGFKNRLHRLEVLLNCTPFRYETYETLRRAGIAQLVEQLTCNQ